MGETMVAVGDVELCVETFGAARDPAILLIAGASAPMDWWDPRFCARLAGGGRFVIRYDHRDTGRSVTYPPGQPGYTFRALTGDPVALIDALAGGRAHVAGLSMGGGIAQYLAIHQPARVASLTLLSTSSGPADDLPPMADRLRERFDNPPPAPDWSDRDAVVEYLVDEQRAYAGRFDEAYTRAVARRIVARGTDPAAAANHWALPGDDGDGDDGDDGDLRSRLGEITAPTLVIHGTADPFFPPGHGEALAREIPNATLLLLDGVGHEVPPPSTWDTVVPAILRNTATAGT
jgi:pimeloyl-ACP methyl ester carboxylesterase